jgi:hypothetical protein
MCYNTSMTNDLICFMCSGQRTVGEIIKTRKKRKGDITRFRKYIEISCPRCDDAFEQSVSESFVERVAIRCAENIPEQRAILLTIGDGVPFLTEGEDE